MACTSSVHPKKKENVVHLERISGFPNEEAGYDIGVSACYSGAFDHKLVMAGGCNFPGKPVAEGGIKCYYKGIYVGEMTNDTTLAWRKAGELPIEAAYGVSISFPEELIIIGGNNLNGGLSSVYALSLDLTGNIVLKTLPSLPCALDNMTGAAIGNKIYVLGGNKEGIPSAAMFSLDKENKTEGWREELAFPGSPRVQPVSVVQNNKLYIWGGFFQPASRTEESIVATDGYCYTPETRSWVKLADVTDSDNTLVTLSGGVAAVWTDSLILCTGGVNKDIFLDALSAKYQTVPQKDYLLQPEEWYRFNGRMMVYNINRNNWTQLGEDSRLARAGAAIARCGDSLYYIGGELKPGIRTTEIYRIELTGN